MPIKRDVIIAGCTGLVGNEILRALLQDPTVHHVYGLTRRELALTHAKLTSIIVEFSQLPLLPHCHEVYLALGTTIKDAGNQSAFRAVDYDANLAVAQAAYQAGAKKIGIVSAVGANPHSYFFYNKIKGELELAVEMIGFEGVTIARPSMLIGDRAALGQPVRKNEYYSQILANAFHLLIPNAYKPIHAHAVADSLLNATPNTCGVKILSSAAMRIKR